MAAADRRPASLCQRLRRRPSPQWAGRCDACGAWNTIVEEAGRLADPAPRGRTSADRGRAHRRSSDLATERAASRRARLSGIAEFDRVLRRRPRARLGDARRRRSRHRQVDPAAAGRRARSRAQHAACVYISGEEALDQVRLRAERLGLADAPVQLAAATSVRDIVATLERPDAPKRSR